MLFLTNVGYYFRFYVCIESIVFLFHYTLCELSWSIFAWIFDITYNMNCMLLLIYIMNHLTLCSNNFITLFIKHVFQYLIKFIMVACHFKNYVVLSFAYSRTSRNYAWGSWYVQNVSIIFDVTCLFFVPLLHAFAMVLWFIWTNILIVSKVHNVLVLHFGV